MIAQADLASLQVTSIKTANYAARFDELVQCDAAGGTFTIIVPGSRLVARYQRCGDTISNGWL